MPKRGCLPSSGAGMLPHMRQEAALAVSPSAFLPCLGTQATPSTTSAARPTHGWARLSTWHQRWGRAGCAGWPLCLPLGSWALRHPSAAGCTGWHLRAHPDLHPTCRRSSSSTPSMTPRRQMCGAAVSAVQVGAAAAVRWAGAAAAAHGFPHTCSCCVSTRGWRTHAHAPSTHLSSTWLPTRRHHPVRHGVRLLPIQPRRPQAAQEDDGGEHDGAPVVHGFLVSLSSHVLPDSMCAKRAPES